MARGWWHSELPSSSEGRPGGHPPALLPAGAADLTELQGYTQSAKDLIDDAREDLTPREYEAWAETVALALFGQRPAA